MIACASEPSCGSGGRPRPRCPPFVGGRPTAHARVPSAAPSHGRASPLTPPVHPHFPLHHTFCPTQDQFDALDFTDNAIQRLDNFPLLTKLKTLLLGANQISRVGDDLGRNLPALETLVLTNNRIASLTEVDALSSLQSLRLLSLLHNSVAKRPHYRLFVIHKLPNLRVLDFQKVRARERLAAKKLFASKEGKQLLAAVARARAFLPGEVIAKAERAAHKRLSARQIAAILVRR